MSVQIVMMTILMSPSVLHLMSTVRVIIMIVLLMTKRSQVMTTGRKVLFLKTMDLFITMAGHVTVLITIPTVYRCVTVMTAAMVIKGPLGEMLTTIRGAWVV